MEISPQAQLAVLIDADNAHAKRIDGLLAEVAKYGRATTKRAYGDWTTQNLGGWKQTLARHAIQPMQQFSNTKGKNSTDSALIIDAMDLLYTERFDGFCIVSSDSDFTRLASRIRESGLTVYGFGERKTPQPFVRACDRFIYVEVLRDGEADVPEEVEAPRPVDRNRHAPPKPPVSGQPSGSTARPVTPRPPAKDSAPIDDPALLGPLCAAVADAGDEDGWAGLGAVGSLMGKRMPEFDPRNYGRKKLSDLVAAIPLFEVEERGEPGRSRALYVREKRVRDAEAKPDVKPDIKVEPKPEAHAAPKAHVRADTRMPNLAPSMAPVSPPAQPVAQPAAPSAPSFATQPEARPEPTPMPKPEPRPVQHHAAPKPAASRPALEPDWAPRRDARLPPWAEPKPVIAATPAPTPPSTPEPAPATPKVSPAVVAAPKPVIVAAPTPAPMPEPKPEPAAAKPVKKAAARAPAAAKKAASKAAAAAKVSEPVVETPAPAVAVKPSSRKPKSAGKV